MYEVHLDKFPGGISDQIVECETIPQALRVTADAMEKKFWDAITVMESGDEYEGAKSMNGLWWVYDADLDTWKNY